MEIHFEAASLIDKHRKTFFIIPCIAISYTSIGKSRKLTTMFTWLCWGTSMQIMWLKGDRI